MDGHPHVRENPEPVVLRVTEEDHRNAHRHTRQSGVQSRRDHEPRLVPIHLEESLGGCRLGVVIAAKGRPVLRDGDCIATQTGRDGNQLAVDDEHLAVGRLHLTPVEREAAPRPRENELLAVPVNKLFDRGTTVMLSANLLRDRIGHPLISLHPEAARTMGLEAGQLVNISFDGVSGDARVRLDETISVGVALVPRSMGFAIREPVPAIVSALAEVK